MWVQWFDLGCWGAWRYDGEWHRPEHKSLGRGSVLALEGIGDKAIAEAKVIEVQGVVMGVEVQVTFDCADPAKLAAFWAEAIGGVVQPPPEGFESWEQALDSWGVPESEWNSRSAVIDPEGVTPRLFFQRVPEGKTAKNRVHLDLRSAPGLEGAERLVSLEATAQTLVAKGATYLKKFEADTTSGGFIVMQDPEGNEFCLD